MSRKLGEILIATGVITSRDLDEALQTQLTAGVRAGTALVQYQMVPLDQVCHGLSIQHGVPCANPESLLSIDREVLELVPPDLCRRHTVLPFRVEGGAICLAMRDPHRDVAGEISLATRRPVKRFVVPELRIMYLLERHLGLPRQPRFLRELTQEPEADERRRHLSATFNIEPRERPAGEPEVLTLDGLVGAEAEPASDLESALRGVRPVDATLARLRAAHSGEAIVRLLVEPVIEGAQVGLLFFVRERHAVACCAHGVRTTSELLQRLVVPLAPPSLMQWAFRMLSVLRGIPDPVQWEIARYFSMPPPGEVCIAPVVPRSKVVNLICVWSGPGQTLGDDAAYVLGELAQGAAAAYLELAERRRLSPSPAL